MVSCIAEQSVVKKKSLTQDLPEFVLGGQEAVAGEERRLLRGGSGERTAGITGPCLSGAD